MGQGKSGGWWKFEERNNAELERSFLQGLQVLETLICGTIYVLDFVSMEQYQVSLFIASAVLT